MTSNEVIAYQEGVDAYFAGEVPEGWDHPDALHDPYLAGWNHSADMENNQHHYRYDPCIECESYNVDRFGEVCRDCGARVAADY